MFVPIYQHTHTLQHPCTHSCTQHTYYPHLFVTLLPDLSEHFWSELAVTHSLAHHLYLLLQQTMGLHRHTTPHHITLPLTTAHHHLTAHQSTSQHITSHTYKPSYVCRLHNQYTGSTLQYFTTELLHHRLKYCCHFLCSQSY